MGSILSINIIQIKWKDSWQEKLKKIFLGSVIGLTLAYIFNYVMDPFVVCRFMIDLIYSTKTKKKEGIFIGLSFIPSIEKIQKFI